MAQPYKFNSIGNVIRISDGTLISSDPANGDRIRYVADGGAAVTDPADPPPVRYNGTISIDAHKHTGDATLTELFRVTLADNTGYEGVLTLVGIDSGNGAMRVTRASVAAKRVAGTASLVGSPVVLADHANANTAGWVLSATASGTDFVVTVTGAAGRPIDWSLSGAVRSFTPAGA